MFYGEVIIYHHPRLFKMLLFCVVQAIPNEIQSEDIVDGILEIALTLRRKYHRLNFVLYGLLPRD